MFRYNKIQIAVLAMASQTAIAQVGPTSLPTQGQVIQGQVDISQSGSQLKVQQQSQAAIINWGTYNIGKDAGVTYVQPGATAAVLNRVANGSSEIAGRLSANGRVYILNPNGIIFSPTAQVNVSGLVAAAAAASDSEWLSGTAVLDLSAGGSVNNRGAITAAQGGEVVLTARQVSNSGIITASEGTISLLSGKSVRVNVTADGLIQAHVNTPTQGAMVENSGKIQADGGGVSLQAQGEGSIVRHSGVIQAQTVQEKEGRIYLIAGRNEAEGLGMTTVSGVLDATAPHGGNGGFIETSAAKLELKPQADVRTQASSGRTGTWLIDPQDFVIAPSGGDMTGIQLSGALSNNNVTIESSSGGRTGSGNIYVNDPVLWSSGTLTLNAEKNIYIYKNMTGSGSAKLFFNYGLGSASLNNDANFFINQGARIVLPEGLNFGTKIGTDGATNMYYVIRRLGEQNDLSDATLQGISNNLSGNYFLGDNINAADSSTWNSGAGFQPIGDNATPFSGNFLGMNNTIDGLTIVNSINPRVGLFGVLSGSIRDVHLLNVSITTSYGGWTGALAGHMTGGPFASIYGSSASGKISDTSGGFGATGGLVGAMGGGGVIQESFANISISAAHAVGGLVGFGFGLIKDSYAIGEIKNAAYMTGGIIGINNGTLSKVYANVKISGTGYIGGLSGYDGRDAPSVTESSYWDMNNSGLLISPSGTGKNTPAMYSKNNYIGWDFLNTWGIDEGIAYPHLKSKNLISNQFQPQLPRSLSEKNWSPKLMKPALMKSESGGKTLALDGGEQTAWKHFLYGKADSEINTRPDISHLPDCSDKLDKQPDPEVECIAKPPTDIHVELSDGDDGTPAKPIAKRRALVLGNTEYNSPLNSLPGTARDAKAISEVLEQQGFEVIRVDNATRKILIKSLNKLIHATKPDDSLIIYYAGHGHIHPGSSMGYWLPSDANVENPSLWISNADLARFMKNMAARQILLVSDSCFSGGLTRESEVQGTGKPELTRDAILKRRSVVVMSSGGEEPVMDSVDGGNSPFTGSLISVLKELKPGSEIRVKALLPKIRASVTAKHKQTPYYGTVLSAGHVTGGDYLFER